MKVLISAGVRSDKIEAGLKERFKAGGVDFIIVPFIDNIDEIYQRGEYFDKAIIVEQSWNHDYMESEEVSIRTRLNRFAQTSANRDLTNVSYVFLTQEEDTASMVYEEILPIQLSSAVLVKQPRYTVTFFASLVTTEIDKFDDQILFKPKVSEEVAVENSPITPIAKNPITYVADYDYDPESEFRRGAKDNANRLNIDQGIGFEKPDIPQNNTPMNNQAEQATENFGFDDFNSGFDDGFRQEFNDNPPMSNESGEIPDMGGDAFETFDNSQNDGFDTGFDAGFEDFDTPGEPPINNPIEHEVHQDAGFEEQTDFDQSGDIPDWSGDQQGYTFEEQQHEEPQIEQPKRSSFNFDKTPENNTDEQFDNQFEYENNPQSGEIPDWSGEYDNNGGDQQPEGEPSWNDGYEDNNVGNQQQNVDDMYDYNDNQYQNNDSGIDDSDYEGYNPELDQYNRTGVIPGVSDSDYDREAPAPAPSRRQYKKSNLSNSQIRDALDAFANRGNSIVVTGCGGCGTSTVALNLANIINRLGYTVLLVDLDTINKTQSYISKDNYECVEPESAGLMAAVNSTSGINAHIAIVRQGFHLLTMGMASDSAPVNRLLHKDKFSRFINLAKTSHNFVIYDIPFETAVGFGSEFTFMADNIVVTVDCSNWGITKTMLNMCNLESDDMQEILFNRGQLLFNKHRVINRVMGRKVKTATDITKVMDFKVKDLLGEDPGYYFQTMHICGLINDDPNFESGWFGNTQYSDTPNGSKIFTEVLKNIVLKQ